METFLSSRVEGLILTVADEEKSLALDALASTGLPFVLMFNPVKPTSYSTVSIDNRRAAYELVDALFELGHCRIAMIVGKLSESDRSIERQAGYEDALREHDLQSIEIVEVGFETTDLSSQIVELNSGANAPTAYFCSTDVLAISAIRALAQIGKRVPDDVSVVGFDGISIVRGRSRGVIRTPFPLRAAGPA